MKSHTEVVMSFGTGIIHSKLYNQKLNTKRLMEAELVGMGEYLPYNIWLMMFLEEQGYKIEENNIYKDNEIIICMENMEEMYVLRIIDTGTFGISLLSIDLMKMRCLSIFVPQNGCW